MLHLFLVSDQLWVRFLFRQLLIFCKRRHCGRLVPRQGQDNHLLLFVLYARPLHPFPHFATSFHREWLCFWRLDNSYDFNRIVRDVSLMYEVFVNIGTEAPAVLSQMSRHLLQSSTLAPNKAFVFFPQGSVLSSIQRSRLSAFTRTFICASISDRCQAD